VNSYTSNWKHRVCDTDAVAYDTAWALSMAVHLNMKELADKLLFWVLSHRHGDGSWGSTYENYHERVLCTLAAVIALSEYKKKFGFGKSVESAINNGLEYLWDNIKKVEFERYSTIAFEVLLPSLMDRATELGLNVPAGFAKKYRGYFEHRISRLGELIEYPPALYSVEFSAYYFPEYLAKYADDMVLPNGSVACSPSATAFVCMMCKDGDVRKRMLLYLGHMLSMFGAMPAVYPFEVFDISWSFYNFWRLGLLPERLLGLAKKIPNYWINKRKKGPFTGIGPSVIGNIVDADDTSLALWVALSLHELGHLRPMHARTMVEDYLRMLGEYSTRDRILCFSGERDESISTNAHALEALKAISKIFPNMRKDAEEYAEIAHKCLKNWIAYGKWVDKWHVSPIYATSHATLSLLGYDDELALRGAETIMLEQLRTGGWGARGGSVEETALALQALSACALSGYDDVCYAYWEDALSYIAHQPPDFSAQWISKSLYTPKNVVRSALNSSLIIVKSFVSEIGYDAVRMQSLLSQKSGASGDVEESW